MSAGTRGLHSTFGLIGRGAALAAGAAGIGGLIQGFKGVYSEAREAQKVGAQTAAVIKSTGGAARISADQVGALATAISNKVGVDDEAIQSGANLLLTFTGIRNAAGKGNDVFNQATRTITDMAAAMNGGVVTSQGLRTASIQVGKALQDPVRGTTALRKAGVALTAQQEKQIRTLVAHGHTLEAQKIILGELNKEFGGSAAAGTNALQKLGVVFGNIKEQVGGALLPIIDRFAGWLANVLPGAVSGAGRALALLGRGFAILKGGFTEGLQGNVGLAGVLERIGDAAHTAVVGVQAMVAAFKEGDVTSDGFVGVMERVGVTLRTVTGFVSRHRDLLVAMGKGIAAVTTAFVAFKVVMTAVNFVMSANPIGVVIVALGALVGGVVYAYKHSERFRAIVQAVWQALQQVGAFLARTFTPTFQALGQAISTRVWPALQNLWAVIQRNIPTFVVFAKFIGGVITVVTALAAKVLGFLLPILAKLAGFLLGRLFGLIAQTVQYFGNMIRAVQSAWGTFRAFLAIVSAVWSAFITRTSVAISRVVGWVSGLGSTIISKFSGAARWLADAGRNVIGGLWDGFKSAMTRVGQVLADVKNAIVGGLKRLFGINSPSTVMAGIGGHIITGLIKGLLTGSGALARTVKSIGGSALSIFGRALGIGQNTSSGAMQSMVAGYASMLYGWRGAEWTALNKLLTRESGFNPNAQNPTSTAYGLFQFLDSTWGAVNARKTSNPQAQTLAGLRYIAGRYGDPINAWAHEMVYGWYGSGLPPTTFSSPTLIGVGESGPETVTVTPRGRSVVGASGGDVHFHFHGPVVAGSQAELDRWLRRSLRDGLLRKGQAALAEGLR